jgi:hypothetical protein
VRCRPIRPGRLTVPPAPGPDGGVAGLGPVQRHRQLVADPGPRLSLVDVHTVAGRSARRRTRARPAASSRWSTRRPGCCPVGAAGQRVASSSGATTTSTNGGDVGPRPTTTAGERTQRQVGPCSPVELDQRPGSAGAARRTGGRAGPSPGRDDQLRRAQPAAAGGGWLVRRVAGPPRRHRPGPGLARAPRTAGRPVAGHRTPRIHKGQTGPGGPGPAARAAGGGAAGSPAGAGPCCRSGPARSPTHRRSGPWPT